MELAPEVEERLHKFDGAPAVDVHENGTRVATINTFTFELKGTPAKPVLRFSLDEYSATHSILAIRSSSDERLSLSIQRFGTKSPGRLDLVRKDYEPTASEIARREFCLRFTRIIAEQFPDEMLEAPLADGEDLEHSLSGNYARGVIRKNSERWAVLAVPNSGNAAASSNSLTSGLLWLARARETSSKEGIAGLRLIVPRGASEMPVRLSKALSSSIHVEVYEFELRNESIRKVDSTAFANRDNWLVTCRNRELLLDRAAAELDPIVVSSPAITLHPNVHTGEVVLRFRGLAFARWHDGVVFFGATGNLRKKLTPSTQPELKQVLHNLENYRHPLASDVRHPLFRAQPERWLETIVRSDVTRIDACLNPNFVYTQLFANSATERSILDILTVTKSGRLAIIELKASDHIHLPLQAADYWLRISQHLERGDFSHAGYFPKLELQKTPPLVYLVAPALRFHSTTGLLLRHLSSSMEVVRVGLAESWRRGLRVVIRQ
jgi:hypothetical protein